MYYVYIIKSHSFNQTYIGSTNNLVSRLEDHNSGKSKHTSKFKPWYIVSYMAFVNKKKAIEFEMYLKSGSGRAFSKKHLI